MPVNALVAMHRNDQASLSTALAFAMKPEWHRTVLKAVSEATARSANSTTHAKACIQVVTVCCDAR